jgi:hypothetical protein
MDADMSVPNAVFDNMFDTMFDGYAGWLIDRRWAELDNEIIYPQGMIILPTHYRNPAKCGPGQYGIVIFFNDDRRIAWYSYIYIYIYAAENQLFVPRVQFVPSGRFHIREGRRVPVH